jgi:uncharacterized LabA/DUF88 family protein
VERVIVYVDGFNVYYGIRRTSYKWLDLGALSRTLLSEDEVVHIRYFTARVRGRPDDPESPVRQNVYLRALRTIPNLSIHFGHFLKHDKWLPLTEPPHEFVQVIKVEEKGSDVNLATHLLTDGFLDAYDTAVVFTNDSDLRPPIEMVRNQLRKKVGVINPLPSSRSRQLAEVASFYKPLRAGALAACQFPDVLQDAKGSFRKPASW